MEQDEGMRFGGRWMDNFMDKLAQRFNAQEIIKANSQAEAQENGRLREQLKAYDECLQEMRKLNLKNVEAAEQVRKLMAQMSELTGQAINAVQENQNAENEKLDTSLEEMKTLLAEMENKLAENEKQIAENCEKQAAANTQLEEFMHKESVKVYRNVQAVLTDELKAQTKELEESFAQKQKGKTGLYILLVLTLLTGLGNLGILLAQLFGVL